MSQRRARSLIIIEPVPGRWYYTNVYAHPDGGVWYGVPRKTFADCVRHVAESERLLYQINIYLKGSL